MIIAPIPDSEDARLRVLQQLEILDTEAEEGLDAIVKAVALVCGVPISLVSLMDVNRQWFKASVGLGNMKESPRDGSFCSHALLHAGLFEVPDALADKRFNQNPLVTGEPHIRFYAGAPIVLAGGVYVGELCVIDHQPRLLNSDQKETLIFLAKAASQLIEMRHLAQRAEHNAAHFQALSEASPLGIYALDQNRACTYTNLVWQQIFGLTEAQSLGVGWINSLHPQDAQNVATHWQACVESGVSFDMEFRIHQPGGDLRVVRSTARQILNAQGLGTGFVGTVQDITQQSQAKHASQSLLGLIDNHFIVSFGDLAGLITDVNDAYCDNSGYSRAELEGQDHRKINSGIHPKPFFVEMWDNLQKGESWQGEVCNRKKNGALHWADSIVAPIKGADGAIERYVSISRDISNRKIFENQLRKSQIFLDRTGRMAGVGGWDIDLNSRTVYWSDETCRIQGVLPGHTPSIEEALEFYTPNSRPIMQEAVAVAMATG